jgi:speckle-type POZ protein
MSRHSDSFRSQSHSTRRILNSGMASNMKTISTCHPPEMVQGTHIFEVLGYSKHRGLGAQFFVQSGVFTVAGHHWALRLYPDDYSKDLAESRDFVSAYLHLLSTGVKVHASCDLRLVDPATGLSKSAHPVLVNDMRMLDPEKTRVYCCMMMQRSVFEGTYVKDDRLTMECVVTVRKDPRVSKTRVFPKIKVPASDIRRQLANLMDQKEGADVMFSVAGEMFAAHKVVLAMRSPVFKAELCGPMSETGKTPIVVEDMQPDVFRAFLYFIYTDSMKGLDHLEEDYNSENCEMIHHLLVAADRYDIARLKLICQSILCKNLDVRNVATTMALADQHHCDRLKDACIDFMSCLSTMAELVATQGYQDLARTSPSILADAEARIGKLNKCLTSSNRRLN